MDLEEFKEIEPLHAKALEFAKSEATMSITKMQRKFMIGYNRAARLCEQLEIDSILTRNRTTGSWNRTESAAEGN